MMKVALTVLLVLLIMHIGAFIGYGAFSVISDLEPPEGASPATMFLSVLLQKTGHAFAFVLIFYVARDSLRARWFAYAALWWLMFALDEIGMAIGPWQTWPEALAGILSETLYFPASGFVTARFLKTR